MPAPSEAPRSFVEILERVWWRLDRALDAEAVEISALVGAIEAAKAGCTTLVDHHASPGRGGSAVDGSLDLVAAAVARGRAARDRLLRGHRPQRRRRSARRPARKRALPRARAPRAAAAGARHGRRPRRLHAVGRHRRGASPTSRGAIAPACTSTSPRTRSTRARTAARRWRGCTRAACSTSARSSPTASTSTRPMSRASREAGAWVVHNPRSNANNAVGYARPSRFGDRLLLGTDGIGADMRAEAQFAFFAARDHGDAHRRRRRAGAQPRVRRRRVRRRGARRHRHARLRSPTPLDDGNFGGHLLFGLGAARVRDVVVDGHVVVREGVCVNVDEERIYARAREIAARALVAAVAREPARESRRATDSAPTPRPPPTPAAPRPG